MGYDRMYWVEGDDDPKDCTWGVDCTPGTENCRYPDPHIHGFACDDTCACRVDEDRWRNVSKTHDNT